MSSKTTGEKRKPSTTQKASHGKQGSTGSTAKPKNEKLTKLQSTGITPDERSQMIAEAAYYRAERRGFNPGGQVKDWLEAELEVDAKLSKAAQKSGELSH